MTVEERFWAKVEKTEGGCWLWTASTVGPYGQFELREGRRRIHRLAHAVAYEWLVGPIPAGHEIHHRCEVTLCVNPAHLEPKTRPEHVAEHLRSHCGRGHELAGANLYVRPDRGTRMCRECRRDAKRRARV